MIHKAGTDSGTHGHKRLANREKTSCQCLNYWSESYERVDYRSVQDKFLGVERDELCQAAPIGSFIRS